jgi:hypothetical protein
MHPAGFETEIPASERPQTHALDRAATGIGFLFLLSSTFSQNLMKQEDSVRGQNPMFER